MQLRTICLCRLILMLRSKIKYNHIPPLAAYARGFCMAADFAGDYTFLQKAPGPALGAFFYIL